MGRGGGVLGGWWGVCLVGGFCVVGGGGGGWGGVFCGWWCGGCLWVWLCGWWGGGCGGGGGGGEGGGVAGSAQEREERGRMGNSEGRRLGKGGFLCCGKRNSHSGARPTLLTGGFAYLGSQEREEIRRGIEAVMLGEGGVRGGGGPSIKNSEEVARALPGSGGALLPALVPKVKKKA